MQVPSLFLSLLVFLPYNLFCQSVEKSEFFPKQKSFPSLFMDPTECQAYISLTKLSDNNILDYNTFLPFGFGFYKPIFKKKWFCATFSTAAHIQFGWRQENKQHFKGTRRSLLNTDYYFALNYSAEVSPDFLVRLSFIHRSSHLGDDMILLNGINGKGYWQTDPTNYELIRLTALRKYGPVSCYSGVEFIYRARNRKRLGFQVGAQFKKLPLSGFAGKLAGGMDIRVLENNGFDPNIKSGLGVSVGKENPMLLLIEYYNGHLPFSRYEQDLKIQWIGVGVYIDALI